MAMLQAVLARSALAVATSLMVDPEAFASSESPSHVPLTWLESTCTGITVGWAALEMLVSNQLRREFTQRQSQPCA